MSRGWSAGVSYQRTTSFFSMTARGGLSEQVENFEKTLIAAELARSHSSVRSLAEALGIPRKTLHDKLRKHGLNFANQSSDDE